MSADGNKTLPMLLAEVAREARPTSTELLCAEVANLRTALKTAKQALELGLLAAKHCAEEMPGLENALDVLEIELAIAKAEAALK